MTALQEQILSKVKEKRSVPTKSLKEFINKIKLISSADWSEVNFLDVEITLQNGVILLSTDLFVKPTDTHKLFDSTSCHPHHCKKGMPYRQTLRLCLNVKMQNMW